MIEMAMTHQLPGSSSTYLSVPSSWSRGSKLNQFSPTFLAVGRKDRFLSLRGRPYSRAGDSLVLGPKSKLFKITAFKGSNRHDDSAGRANDSKSLKKPFKVSYLQRESEESTEVQNVVPSPYTIADDTTTKSLAIQMLFKKWLMLLRTPSKTQAVGEALEEPSGPSPIESPETPNTVQKQERSGILKVAWCYFWSLDATIKIPLLVFAPLYLAVNIVYGSQVSKELNPLWILGPIITVLYVKAFRAICSLYVFTFKLTVKVVKNLPTYALLVHAYLFGGKLKEIIRTHVRKPFEDLKNVDYNVLKKDLQEWLCDKYLDFIEWIWPYYRSILRFMRKKNLV